jgi:tRNA dimethylallyltransferase
MRDSASPQTLEPLDRGWLHARIAERFDQMLQSGLLDEVRALRARSDLHAALPSMRSVGYRQAWQALDSGTLQGLRDRGIAATRQLAKRQLTWLRSMARRSVACDDPQVFERVLGVAQGMLGVQQPRAP